MKTTEELFADYALNDGEICSLRLEVNYADSSPLVRQATLEVLIRKRTVSGHLVPCLLVIHLFGVQKIVINEDFALSCYSDMVFKELEREKYYLSFDPYGNSGEPHEDDNLIFIASAIKIEEGVVRVGFKSNRH